MKSSRSPAATFIAASAAAVLLTAASSLPQTTLHAGGHRFDVEVAATPAQRAQGLMGRTQLAEDAGMLFVFEKADQHCFWMKDTLIPLSVAFLDDDGTIVNIDDMEPHSTGFHCAAIPVRFALEVRQGAFRDHGIRPGGRFGGGPLGGPQ